MNDYTKAKLKILIAAIFFIFAVYLQSAAQMIRSPKGLLLQLLSMSILLAIIYIYNKSYQ